MKGQGTRDMGQVERRLTLVMNRKHVLSYLCLRLCACNQPTENCAEKGSPYGA